MTPASIASLTNLRIAPNKLRVVANQIRGLHVQKALDILKFSPRSAAAPLFKLVKSAIANADQKGRVDVDRLFIATLCINEGPSLKRSRPRSRGMANPIIKRSSHLQLALGVK